MTGTRALITGITGQDGLYLAELLLAKGYEVYGLIRGQNNPKRELVERAAARRHAAHRRPHRPVQPDPGAARRPSPTRSTTSAPISFVAYSWENAALTTDVTGKGVLNMLEAVRLYAGDDLGRVRFYQASSSEMFGKVQEVPQRETTLLWPRSPYGVAKVFGHYMTINYRESYGMHASSGHPVQPRVAAPRAGVRDPQGQPGGRPDHARPAGRASRWATSTPSATGASPATTSRRCG